MTRYIPQALSAFLTARSRGRLPGGTMNGIRSIAAERRRQVESEGWSPEHDDKHDPGEIAGAGAAYALNAACLLSPYHGTPLDEPPESWLWSRSWWKPNMGDDPRRDLVKAGALIAAEIDRLDREAARKLDLSK